MLFLISLFVQASDQFTGLKFCMTTAIYKVTTILDTALLPKFHLNRRESHNLFSPPLFLNNQMSALTWGPGEAPSTCSNSRGQECLGSRMCSVPFRAAGFCTLELVFFRT